jgi:hypothetical protein
MDNLQWQERRSEFRYKGVVFSPEGNQLLKDGVTYAEIPFTGSQGRRFSIWLFFALLIFAIIPLMAWAGWQDWIFWFALPYAGLLYYLHGRIHRCPRCGGRSKLLTTSYMNSPVLYLCPRCRTFFEHGQIDGGMPWH